MKRGPKDHPPKPPSLRERIENNLVVFFLATLVSGFVAGVGAFQGVLKAFDFTPVAGETLRGLKEATQKIGSSAKAEPIKHLVRSEAGDHPPATINIVNSLGREVDLVWIDTSGAERSLKRISTGTAYSAATFATHLLLLKDATSGEQIFLFTPRGT